MGIALSFYVDGLSLLFALLISFIGKFIILYAGAYLKGHADLGRFFMFLLMFMGSMLGLVLSDNVVILFVFWELTSFPLILTTVAILGNALMFAVAFLVGLRPFFGKPGDTPHKPHEGSIGVWIGALTLAVLSLFFGLFSGLAEIFLVGPAAVSVASQAMAVDLYLWGGFKVPVVASIITVALGLILFWQGVA